MESTRRERLQDGLLSGAIKVDLNDGLRIRKGRLMADRYWPGTKMPLRFTRLK